MSDKVLQELTRFRRRKAVRHIVAAMGRVTNACEYLVNDEDKGYIATMGEVQGELRKLVEALRNAS